MSQVHGRQRHALAILATLTVVVFLLPIVGAEASSPPVDNNSGYGPLCWPTTTTTVPETTSTTEATTTTEIVETTTTENVETTTTEAMTTTTESIGTTSTTAGVTTTQQPTTTTFAAEVLPTQLTTSTTVVQTTVAQEVLPFTGAPSVSLWILGLSLFGAGVLVLASGRKMREQEQ